MSSPLVAFYTNMMPIPSYESLRAKFNDVLAWPDDVWEKTHDFIQWLFPLPETSKFNLAAPLLTEEDRQGFIHKGEMRDNLERAYYRFIEFMGLFADAAGLHIKATSHKLDMWQKENHNWLRMSRVLRCLVLCEREDLATELFEFIENMERRNRPPTFNFGLSKEYWEKAMRSRELTKTNIRERQKGRGLMEICLGIHMEHTGASDPVEDCDGDIQLLKDALATWEATMLRRSAGFDNAVQNLIRATLREHDVKKRNDE